MLGIDFSIINRIIEWISLEPVIGLLMVITALALFVTAYRSGKSDSQSFWPWMRRILEASVAAVLFLGLLWAFRSILNSNSSTFNATHGSFNDATLQSAQSIWGRPHVQREIGYTHYTEVTRQEEVPRSNPDDPPQYRNVTTREPVPQNSVIGFEGIFNLTLSEREKGYAYYNGYLLDAQMTYQTVNDSDAETECEFDFPLSSGQTIFSDFSITVDGKDISSLLRFSPDLVQWTTPFHPHQQQEIIIRYKSRGMASFYYQIPSQREIKNFKLTVTLDRLPVSLVNYPDGALTPTHIEPTSDGNGSVLTWEMNKAITVAGMGVALPQPEQRGQEVLRVLSNSPYSLTLLATMLALTLLLQSEPVHFVTLALILGAYAVEFLLMAAVSDFALGFWGSLMVGAVVTGLLTYLLFRKHPARQLIFSLIFFFTVLYPLSGLVADLNIQNSLDTLVRVGMIIYLFVLALRGQADTGTMQVETA
jgi:hypothetical protein